MAIELITWTTLAADHKAACLAVEKAVASFEYAHGRLDLFERARARLESVELRMDIFVARGGSVDGNAVNISFKGRGCVPSSRREREVGLSLLQLERMARPFNYIKPLCARAFN